MKNTNKYKYISLASVILMPFGATAVSAVESTITTDNNELTPTEVTDKTSESDIKTELPSLDKVINNGVKKDSKSAATTAVAINPLALTFPADLDWGGLTITVEDDGTLIIPGGTINNPESLTTFVSKNAISPTKITKIKISGPLTITGSADSLFANFGNMTSIEGITNINTSGVTSMFNMFHNLAMSTLDLSSFDTSNVTNMSGMFSQSDLTNINLSGFNTSKVTNMSKMFFSANKLTSIDISNFNTANVTDMSSMFSYLKGLTSLNIKGINTASGLLCQENGPKIVNKIIYLMSHS